MTSTPTHPILAPTPGDSQEHIDKEKAVSTDPEVIPTTATPVIQRPTPFKWFLVCVGLYLGALLYGLDTTIAADVQVSVYKSLGELEKLPWVGIGFPLGSVAVILLVGKLYGTFDIKGLIIGSIIIFEGGSALCGGASTANDLIIGRVIAGIGGAGMYIGALTYISVFTSLRERPIYVALTGFFWGLGAILGPVVGGGFARSGATWRWAFYINLPLAGLLSPVYFFVFPKHNSQPLVGVKQKLTQLDWAGTVLNALSFVTFVVALSFSGSQWKWGSGPSTALWVIFGVSLICYVAQQAFSILTTPERRLFPVQFLKTRTLILLYLTTAATATSMPVTLYYVPLFFQFTKGDSALQAAIRLLPFIIMFVFSVMFSGGLLPVFGRYAPWYFPSAVFVVIGGSLMFRMTASTHTAAIYGFEVLIAIGTGLIFQTGYSVAAALVKPEEAPAAIGFINVAQIGTMSIALSMSGALFQNLGYRFLTEALASYDFPEEALRGALAGAQSVVLGSEGPVVRDLAIGAIVKTISKLYGMVIAAGALTLVSACLFKPPFFLGEKLKLDPAAGA